MKKRDTLKRLLQLGVLAASASFALPALSQDAFPSKRITIVVPTGAGGITDVLARIVGQQLSVQIGQPVIIDNRPGASGILGSNIVAKAAPDGYTLLMVFPTHPVNPHLFAKMPYDTANDFAGVSKVSTVSLVLLTNPTSGINSVKDLIKAAQQKPGELNFGSVGSGSLGHLGSELFTSSANVKMTHIPYKGVPQVLAALMSNEISIYFDTPVTAIGQVKGGKLKALGVSTKTRNPSLPNVPTIEEAGLPGYEVTSWNGLLAPAGTPAPIIGRLNKEIVAALKHPEVKAKFAELGAEPTPTTPAAFDEEIRRDLKKWAQVIKNANIKPE
jgi:tripartite-type tricarboxylate transporter receptor subunit TctC